jgi:hypothetical protein
MWACITVCPAASPSLTPTLNPEVLIYRRPLTTPERFALGTHLTKKYAGFVDVTGSDNDASIATESSAPGTTHVLRRGNYLRPGLEVNPELPEILAPSSAMIPLRTARQITERYGCSRTRQSSVFHGDSQSLANLAKALISRAVLSADSRAGLSGRRLALARGHRS